MRDAGSAHAAEPAEPAAEEMEGKPCAASRSGLLSAFCRQPSSPSRCWAFKKRLGGLAVAPKGIVEGGPTARHSTSTWSNNPSSRLNIIPAARVSGPPGPPAGGSWVDHARHAGRMAPATIWSCVVSCTPIDSSRGTQFLAMALEPDELAMDGMLPYVTKGRGDGDKRRDEMLMMMMMRVEMTGQ